jgi:hypothetical protein
MERTLHCRVAASLQMCASAEMIAQWRRQPLRIGEETFSPSLLKHSEEQTVLALRTLLQTIAQQGWPIDSFTDWGVIAAPTYFGRVGMAQTFERFQQESAWGVSPHLIPQQSLHGMSGTISQALSAHGPNFGIGGGPDSSAEAFLLAAALLADGQLPGLWLIITGHEEEILPGYEGQPTQFPPCHALVLALTSAHKGLEFRGQGSGVLLAIGQNGPLDYLPLFQLQEAGGKGLIGKWRLSKTHWVEFSTANEVLP